MDYKQKYLKYKQKYLNLKKQIGARLVRQQCPDTDIHRFAIYLWRIVCGKLNELDQNYNCDIKIFEATGQCNLWIWKRDGPENTHIDIWFETEPMRNPENGIWTLVYGYSVKLHNRHIYRTILFCTSFDNNYYQYAEVISNEINRAWAYYMRT